MYADRAIFLQPNDRARGASRTERKMLVLMYSTRSAVVHGLGTTIEEQALTPGWDTVRTQTFDDLYPCTTHLVV